MFGRKEKKQGNIPPQSCPVISPESRTNFDRAAALFFFLFFCFDFRRSKMVVKRCSWGKCNADSRYPDRYPGVKFIPFAKPKRQLEKCLRWIKACGRPYSQLNVEKIHDWTYICSRVSGSSTFCLKVEQP